METDDCRYASSVPRIPQQWAHEQTYSVSIVKTWHPHPHYSLVCILALSTIKFKSSNVYSTLQYTYFNCFMRFSCPQESLSLFTADMKSLTLRCTLNLKPGTAHSHRLYSQILQDNCRSVRDGQEEWGECWYTEEASYRTRQDSEWPKHSRFVLSTKHSKCNKINIRMYKRKKNKDRMEE